MNKQAILRTACLLILSLGLAVLISCLAPQVTSTEVEDEIYRLVNEKRQAIGLTSLARDADLDELAGQFVASELSHIVEESTELRYLLHSSWWATFTGGPPRLDEGTARKQVDYCLDNAELREAMFRSEARAMGVRVAVVDDTVYYTQVFDVINAATGEGEPIELYENTQAADPLWGQLRVFLLQDDTDGNLYIPDSFVCADFATMLHNRAEEAGIKAAYVSVDFVEGPAHALNAFNTIDRGLVYIDCTGQGFQEATSEYLLDNRINPGGYDKVAYVVVGRRYGLVALDAAASFDYAFYEQWTQQWAYYKGKLQVYEQKLDEYNEALGGRTVINDPVEYARLQGMANELDALKAELEGLEALLGNYSWEPLGIVSSVYAHW